MLGEDLRQALRLLAEVSPYGLLCMRREVALREQEVEDRLHGGQPKRELLRREVVGLERKLPKPTTGAAEPFVHVCLAGEEPLGNLTNVETAQRLQRDHQLGLDGDRVIAA